MNDSRLSDLILSNTEENIERADIILIGVPTDEGIIRNGGRPGAALAPDTIRSFLYILTPHFLPECHSLDVLHICDSGNIPGDSIEAMHANARIKLAEFIHKGKTVVALGGGHDVTYPLVTGFYEGIGKQEFVLINIDAHLDVREKRNGLHHSGSSFRLLIEDGVLRGSNFTEFGIQSFAYSADHLAWVQDQGADVLHFDTELRINAVYEFQKIIDSITSPLYVTFDIDSIRSSDAPGCSASSPIGFTAEDAIDICYTAGKRKGITMLDIVEVSPPHDIDNRTSRLAARMIGAYLTGRANQ